MKIPNLLKKILIMFWIPAAIILIGVLVGWITNNELIGFFTMCGLIVALELRGIIVEIIAKIKKTGVYADKDKKE